MARISAVALVAAVMASTASAVNVFTIDVKDCPPGWTYSAGNNNDPNTYCCPGTSNVVDDGGYCCLGSSFDSSDSSDSSDIFSDSEDFFTLVKRDIPEPSCAATVDYKDPDYSSKVTSLSKSLYATSTGGSDSKPASNTATTTATTATSTGSSDNASATDDSASATDKDNAAASSTSSDNAGAMPTAEIVGGILAMAAAFAM